jgi:CRISPR-associated exonuclease Cas4
MIKRTKFDEEVQLTEVKDIIEEESLAAYDKRRDLYDLEHGQVNYFYASSVFQCPKKIFYDFKTGHVQYTAQTCRIFENGEAVHERICKYLRSSKKVKLREEVPIDPIVIGNSSIHGRIDGWLTFVEAEKEHLIEIKSINADNVAMPKKEHVAQLTLYMGATGIHSGSVIYESKRNNQIFEFPLAYRQEIYDEALKFFAEVKQNIDDNVVPVVHYRNDAYPCRWKQGRCPHYEKCWGCGIQRSKVRV